MRTHTEAVETFLASANWLTDADEPSVALLRTAAAELDAEWKAATAQQFGLAHRYLMNRKPAEESPTEQDEDLTFS